MHLWVCKNGAQTDSVICSADTQNHMARVIDAVRSATRKAAKDTARFKYAVKFLAYMGPPLLSAPRRNPVGSCKNAAATSR